MKPFGVVTKSGKYVGQQLLNQYAVKSEPRKLKDAFGSEYNGKGLIAPIYNPEALSKLLEVNTYHYRACKTKARDTAGLGWELEPVEGQEDAPGGNADALQAMLESLTPPLPIVLDKIQTDYESIGWGCMEMVRVDYAVDGPLADLEHVPSHTIRLHKDGIRIYQKRGLKHRWFKAVDAKYDVHKDTGAVAELGALPADDRATELLMWTNYTPRSDYYGLPDIMPALGAIQGDISRRDYNIAFFDNFGVPAYAVFITGDFIDDDEEETDADGVTRTTLELAIEKHFQELAKNPHSTLILTIPGNDVKVEFKPLATDVKEASFRLYRADNRDEILAAHGVPPYRAGIAETGSLGGNVAAEATEIYKRSVIEPRQTVIEHYFNRYIVEGAFGVTTRKFKLATIDTTDEKHDMDMIERLHKMGVISTEEVRAIWAKRFNLSERVDAPEPEGETELDAAPLEVLEMAAEQMFERVRKSRDKYSNSLRLVERGSATGDRATGAEGVSGAAGS